MIKTKNEAIQITKYIDECLNALFVNTTIDLAAVINEHLPEELTLQFKDLDKEAIVRKLTELKSSIENTEVIHITLPFLPKESLLSYIHNEISKKLSCNVFLDFSTDIFMLGGQILERKGRYYDYSLKTKLNNLLDTTYGN